MRKKCLTAKGLKTDNRGRVLYRGKYYKIDTPVPSTRKGKKKMVLADKGGCLKLIHFGAEGYRHNYSPEARQRYARRSAGIRNAQGKLTKADKHSANYWARKYLWDL